MDTLCKCETSSDTWIFGMRRKFGRVTASMALITLLTFLMTGYEMDFGGIIRMH
jgi:hypothetical protein